MKGLYVYGALLMGMSFTVGLAHSVGSPLVVALSLLACGLAALGEAGVEATRFRWGPSPAIINLIALASWAAAALAAIAALFEVL